MSVPSTETLWAYVKGELSPDEAARVKAQLEASEAARAALADVEASVAVLSLLPPVPAMPDAMARRVGERLAEVADAEGSRSFTAWWQSLLSFRVLLPVAAAAAVVVGLVLWNQRPTDGAGGGAPVANAVEPSTPLAPLAPVPVPPRAPKPVKAVVASAKNAKVGGGASLARAQVLETGAQVSTAAGGSLWLKLPDGTKAGLTSATDVTLAKLDQHELSLEVKQGSLAMVVPHREDRLLTVKAGDVEVKDLGTRFLVSREVARVVVAVEEGSVEVKTPKATQVVTAGHAVAWHEGELDDYAWPTSGPTPPPLPGTGTPAAAATPEVPPAVAATPPGPAGEEDDEAADVEPPAGNPEDEWATLPSGTPSPPVNVEPPPAMVPDVQPPPAPPVNGPPSQVVTVQPKRRHRPSSGFSLKAIEEHLRELERQAHVPFAPITSTTRESAARTIARLADAGDHDEALELADAWLRGPASASPLEPAWRRSVLQQKVRCLNHLGRTAEALEVQRLLGR
ncbi:MAG: FecR family protein [Myxococcaceae bacterium]|jgi:ferric-dicitrate binding protein FerR (iron transport regulator)|nr:FecR family protein [Myxococcaceae bacterium]